MTDIISKIIDYIEEYELLCSRYGESPKLNYGKHAYALKERALEEIKTI